MLDNVRQMPVQIEDWCWLRVAVVERSTTEANCNDEAIEELVVVALAGPVAAATELDPATRSWENPRSRPARTCSRPLYYGVDSGGSGGHLWTEAAPDAGRAVQSRRVPGFLGCLRGL
jgi:hypothetical protein